MLRLASDSGTLLSLDCSAYSIPYPPPVYPIQSPLGPAGGPTHVAILACRDSVRGLVALFLRGQPSDTSNDFSIGALLCPTPAGPQQAEDGLQIDYVRGTYITWEKAAILRAGVVLSELQHQWTHMFNLVCFSTDHI